MNRGIQTFALAALLATTAAFQLPGASTTATTQTYPLIRVTSSVPAYSSGYKPEFDLPAPTKDTEPRTLVSEGNQSAYDIDRREFLRCKALGDRSEERMVTIVEGMETGLTECKLEASRWQSTKNHFVELECRHADGQWYPSGLAVTEANVWFVTLEADGKALSSIAVDTERMRELVQDAPIALNMHGANWTKGALVSLTKLIGLA